MSTRERVLEQVRKTPGIHFRAIMRELRMAIGQTQYHLYRLEQEGLIRSKGRPNTKHYYPVEKKPDIYSQILKSPEKQ